MLDEQLFRWPRPLGFQAREGHGLNAYPKYWELALADGRFHDLRLCLGHAGGGDMTNGGLRSYGWYAND